MWGMINTGKGGRILVESTSKDERGEQKDNNQSASEKRVKLLPGLLQERKQRRLAKKLFSA